MDNEIAERRYFYVDHWVKRRLEAGEELASILTRLGKWLRERGTIRALEFAAAVVTHVGERCNLEFLDIQGIEPIDKAQAIIADARFAVSLQSLI